jgi:small-conductance mechanosensitive channel
MKALEHILANNSTQSFAVALAVGIASFFALSLLRRLIATRLGALATSTAIRWDDLLVAVISGTRNWMLAGFSLLLALIYLDLPAALSGGLTQAVMALLFLQCGLWASHAVRFWLAQRIETSAEEDAGGEATTLAVVAFVLRLVLWSVVLVLVLDQMGFNVTTLVASLGVGGVAVALAVQNILGDLFGSLSIALDKPIVIGDFIVVDDIAGTVENVGLKTTRIRSLSGEQVVMSNADLLGSRIRNFKRMQERRIVFPFGVTYDTGADRLAAIPAMLREIVEAVDDARFDRAHFHRLGESSLDFEVVYYVTIADYARFMDIQQQINLGMVQRFAEAGIGFAFPTRTVHVASLPAAAQTGC